ncbi:MAG: carbamate kinase [Firmicutes bacterium]|nr:carbamate kinase [Bacillota bacterium]
MSKIVIALGGNAMVRPGEAGGIEEQTANLSASLTRIVELVGLGHQITITHGNGPQVGNLLIQQEAARRQVPSFPLDVSVAQTQGQIGYLIQNGLSAQLKKQGIDKPVTSLITRVLVRESDPAFQNPSKPVGPFFSEEHARERMARGEDWIEDSGRGWRKVVPSPQPVEIVELPIIKALAGRGAIVIAAGGGGIPVVERSGTLVGIEAVVDKDLTGCLLAADLDADLMVILTDVEKVALNFGTPNQIDLAQITLSEARNYQKEGHFGAGSMGPKVEAACKFVEITGGRAIITSLDRVVGAVQGKAGTSIVR